jgi:hypothetical protein
MKLVMVVYSGSRPQTVTRLLEAHDVRGWTEFAGAHGVGASGRRESTRAWPGDAAVFFSIVDAAHADELATALEAESVGLPAGERLHAAVMPVERFF